MMRWLPVLLLLAGCAAPHRVLPALPACPGPVAEPAALPHVRTPAQIGKYATAVELAREQERARGDACAARAAALEARP